MADAKSKGYQAGAHLAEQFLEQERQRQAVTPRGQVQGLGTTIRQFGAVVDPMGEYVTSTLAGEEPQLPSPSRETVAFGLRTAPSLVPSPVVSGALSAAGEAGAQLVESGKITDPAQIAVAGTLPPAARAATWAVGSAVRGMAKRLPGAASVLQEEAVAAARAIPRRFDGPGLDQRAETLYQQVEKLNPRIRSTNLRAAVNELKLTELRTPEGLRGPLHTVTEGLTKLLNEHGDEVPFQELRATLRRLGQRTGSVQGLEANELRGGFKHLVSAIQDDLEIAARRGGKGGAAADLLREANQLYAKARAVDELSEAIEAAINKGRSDLQQSFNPARALNELASSPNLPRAFTKEELEDIRHTLMRFKGLPSLPPPGGEAAIGSGRVIGRIIAGAGLGSAAGAGLSEQMGFGSHLGAGFGMAAGAAASNLIYKGIAAYLATPQGRRFLLRQLDEGGGVLTEAALRTLAQAGRTYMAGLNRSEDE